MKIPFKKTKTKPQTRQRREKDSPAASFSYHARRAGEVSTASRHSQSEPRQSRTKSRFKGFLVHLGLYVMLLALVASALNILWLSTTPKIVPLTTDSSLLRDQSVYQAAAEQLLKQSPSNRLKLSVNTTHLSSQLAQQFPELASVNVTIPVLTHRPVIYIEAGQPAIILSASSGSFVISTTGKVLAPSSQVSPALRSKLSAVTDQNGVAISSHAQALPTDSVRFIQTIAAQLTAKHFVVAAMTLPHTAGELDVQITGQPYFVKFNVQSNTPVEQAGTYFATIAQAQKQGSLPSQYVDVRVEGRAYYQ